MRKNPHTVFERRMRKPNKRPATFSRRERQVMDILLRRGEATAAEVMGDLPDPPTYSSVRSILGILVEKGHARYRGDGLRYVYLPARDTERLREEALKHVIQTFFQGSTDQAIAAALRISDGKLTDAHIARIQQRIKAARERGN